jgi:hypothetical protein
MDRKLWVTTHPPYKVKKLPVPLPAAVSALALGTMFRDLTSLTFNYSSRGRHSIVDIRSDHPGVKSSQVTKFSYPTAVAGLKNGNEIK